MELFETSITNDTFQLYGEDLRCLDSGKPMLTVFYYDAEIDYTIEMCKKNINTKVCGSSNPLLRRFSIKQIGENSFKYDKNMKINDVFETTNETDIHAIFNTFDRRKYMYRIYASTKSNFLCVVWSHAIMDGITAQYGMYTILGKSIENNVPLQHPPLIFRPYYALETMFKLREFLCDSQLTRDLQLPNFQTMCLKISEIKRISKLNKVSFPATACAMYLSRVFNALPNNVSFLKVFVSVYIKNENRFNDYSVIPIIVWRDKCNPTQVSTSLNDNKTMLFGFYELFRTNLLTRVKSQIDNMKPDVIFSPMKNNSDIGEAKLNRVLVYNYSSSAKIYACGIQTGEDNFYINSSIQVSNVSLPTI
jgi:hypothetical protein